MIRTLPVAFLRLSIGLFFIVLGITGVVPNVQESVFSLNDNLNLEIVFGIVEIICGLILIIGLFTFMKRKAVSVASIIILLFWVTRIVTTKFIWGLSTAGSGIIFRPNFSTWLLVLSCELIIAASLYLLYRAYD